MRDEKIEFVIYMVNELANRYGLYPSFVYKKMDETGCINDYLISLYDVLHTMSSESVCDDIITFMKTRGVSI